MALIVCFANQKGGVGKSTAVVLAAGALSAAPFSYRTAVVDLDPQQSVSRLRSYDLEEYTDALAYDVLTYNLATFTARLAELEQRYELILLDVAGKLDTAAGKHSEALQVIQYADVVFIPVTPGNFAIEATLDYIRAALAIRNLRPALRLIAFRNMARTRSVATRRLSGELADLERLADVPVMRAGLRRYTEFEDANTLRSLYDPAATQPALVNFREWLDELHARIFTETPTVQGVQENTNV